MNSYAGSSFSRNAPAVLHAPQPVYPIMTSRTMYFTAGSPQYTAASYNTSNTPTCAHPQAIPRSPGNWSRTGGGKKRLHSITPPSSVRSNDAGSPNPRKKARPSNARTPLPAMTRSKTPAPETQLVYRHSPAPPRAVPNDDYLGLIALGDRFYSESPPPQCKSPMPVPKNDSLGPMDRGSRIYFHSKSNGKAPLLLDIKNGRARIHNASDRVLKENPLAQNASHILWAFNWPGFQGKNTKMQSTLLDGTPVTRMQVATEIAEEIYKILEKMKPEAQQRAKLRSNAQRLAANIFNPSARHRAENPPKYQQDLRMIAPEWDLNKPREELFDRLHLLSLDYYPQARIWVPTLRWDRIGGTYTGSL